LRRIWENVSDWWKKNWTKRRGVDRYFETQACPFEIVVGREFSFETDSHATRAVTRVPRQRRNDESSYGEYSIISNEVQTGKAIGPRKGGGNAKWKRPMTSTRKNYNEKKQKTQKHGPYATSPRARRWRETREPVDGDNDTIDDDDDDTDEGTQGQRR